MFSRLRSTHKVEIIDPLRQHGKEFIRISTPDTLETMRVPKPSENTTSRTVWSGQIFTDWRVLMLLIIVATCLTRFPATTVSFWGDELKTMHDASGGPIDAIRYQATQGGHPPFYYILVSLWQQISLNDVWIRTLSVVFGLFTVGIIGRIAYELCNARLAWIAASFATITHPLCWTSVEARNYALHILMGTLAWLFLIRGLKRNKWSDWLAYSVSMALCWYSFYYGFYIAVGLGVFVLATRPAWARLLRYSLSSLLAIALYSPWIGVLSRQMSRVDTWAERPIAPQFSIIDLVRLDMRAFALHGPWNIFGVELSPRFGAPPTTSIFVAVLLTMIGIFIWRNRTKPGLSAYTRQWFMPVAASSLAYIIATNYTAYAGAYAWLRYMTFAGVPFCILAALLVNELPPRAVKTLLPIYLSLGVIMATDRAFGRTTTPWREAVHWVASNSSTGETIIVNNLAQHAIQYYGDSDLKGRTREWNFSEENPILAPNFTVFTKTPWGEKSDRILDSLDRIVKGTQERRLVLTQKIESIEIRRYSSSEQE
ncbi:glycosyltransferase family 39 protein [bacterium]|nr:glycosyltransferase family 39 protein [Verrucomicrobiota bacterium]MDA7633100.1 glycosyltransferase family 39 protein [bacterium]MDA7680270.1 glycosyltransferase family 39 protein [bacterium]